MIIYHQFPLKNCLKPSGRLELRDVLERYLSDSSSSRSERICSHAVSSEDLSRGSEDRTGAIGTRRRALSHRSRERSRERSRRRSLPSAPCSRARAHICRVRGTRGVAEGRRHGEAPGCGPRSAFPPTPVKGARAQSRVGSLRLRPGDTDGPGPGRAHGLVLEPSRTAGPEPTRALRGAPPSRGLAMGFRSSLPR